MSRIKYIRSFSLLVAILLCLLSASFFTLPFILFDPEGAKASYTVSGLSLAFDFKKTFINEGSCAGYLVAFILILLIAIADIILVAGPYLFNWDKSLNVLYCSVGVCVANVVAIILLANTIPLGGFDKVTMFEMSTGAICGIIFMSFSLMLNLVNSVYYLVVTNKAEE